MTYRIAAYLTAYQDKEAVESCLLALQKQSYPIEAILVVDNSSTAIASQVIANNPKIIVQSYPENLGVSGGLKIAIQWAIDNNYDFLWTFDQDSEPSPAILEKLLVYYDDLSQQAKKIGIIAPLPVDSKTGQYLGGLYFQEYKFVEASKEKSQEEFYSCDAVITSGSLVVVEAAKLVEPVREDLFIDAVDWDFCLKFKEKGYEIIVLNQVQLNHRYGNSHQIYVSWLNRKITINNYSPLRYYYICRNHTFIENLIAKKNHQLWKSVIYRLRCCGVIMSKVILYESNLKVLKVWACLRGTIAGFRGKLGNNW